MRRDSGNCTAICGICCSSTEDAYSYGFYECYKLHSFCEDCFLQIKNDCPFDRIPIERVWTRNRLSAFEEVDRFSQLKTVTERLIQSRIEENRDFLKALLKRTFRDVGKLVFDCCEYSEISCYVHLGSISAVTDMGSDCPEVDRNRIGDTVEALERLPTHISWGRLKSIMVNVLNGVSLLSNLTPGNVRSNLKLADRKLCELKMDAIQLRIFRNEDYTNLFPGLHGSSQSKCLTCFQHMSRKDAAYRFKECEHMICCRCETLYNQLDIVSNYRPFCPVDDGR